MLKKPEPKPAASNWRDRKNQIAGDNQTMATGNENIFGEDAFGSSAPAGTVAGN